MSHGTFSSTWLGKEQHKQNRKDPTIKYHSGMLVIQKRLALVCKCWLVWFDSKKADTFRHPDFRL